MAKITFKKPNLGALLIAPRWIRAAAAYFKERLGKSTRNGRLLEPHFSILSSKAESTVSAPDAIGNAPNQLGVDFSKGSSSTSSSQWSLELLYQTEERQFEELVAAYFREESFRTEISQVGNYEGIDINLYKKGKQELFAIVQCKVSHTQKVGVRCIRELLGAMIHARVPRGIFVTTGDFAQEAVDFAKQHPIILITGELLIKDILSYSDDSKIRLLNVATAGRLDLVDASPAFIPEEVSNSPNSPIQVSDAKHIDSNAGAEERLSVKTVDPDVAAENESNTLEFSVPKLNEQSIAPDAAIAGTTKESPTIADVQTDEVSNSIDFDLFDSIVPDVAKEADKEKEQNENKTAPDDSLEKHSNTIDFPPLELPDGEQKTKPAEFFGVFR